MKRDQFLGRVKSALRDAQFPEVSGPSQAPEIVFDDVVARFIAEAEAVACEVTRAGSAADVFAAINSVFVRTGSSTFLSWNDLVDVAPGWDSWVDEAGYQRVDATVRQDPAERQIDNARAGSVVVGVTGADWGIAASGSVVLSHGPGRARSASLLVEHHVVLLPTARVVGSLHDAMGRVGWEDNSNIAVITGPSRTGDIESILTIGVHGPHHVHIILIG